MAEEKTTLKCIAQRSFLGKHVPGGKRITFTKGKAYEISKEDWRAYGYHGLKPVNDAEFKAAKEREARAAKGKASEGADPGEQGGAK